MVRRYEVTGIRELGEAFRTLGKKVQNNIARATTNAGAQVFKKRIAELAPVAPEPYKIEGVVVQPGNLKRNVVTKHLKKSQTSATSEHLVLMRGKKEHGYASRVGALQEFGTVKQQPQPFFRPGAEQAVEPAIDAMTKRFKQRIDKAIQEASQ